MVAFIREKAKGNVPCISLYRQMFQVRQELRNVVSWNVKMPWPYCWQEVFSPVIQWIKLPSTVLHWKVHADSIPAIFT